MSNQIGEAEAPAPGDTSPYAQQVGWRRLNQIPLSTYTAKIYNRDLSQRAPGSGLVQCTLWGRYWKPSLESGANPVTGIYAATSDEIAQLIAAGAATAYP